MTVGEKTVCAKPLVLDFQGRIRSLDAPSAALQASALNGLLQWQPLLSDSRHPLKNLLTTFFEASRSSGIAPFSDKAELDDGNKLMVPCHG